MRTVIAFLLLVTATACQSTAPQAITPVSDQGVISIEVAPNPIVARRVSGNMYEFPIHVIVRETGGRAVNITRVSVTVKAPGGFVVARENWDAEHLRSTGTSTTIAALSESRYPFTQRQVVPSERLFIGVTLELRVEGIDDKGNATGATTQASVRKEPPGS